LVNNKGESVAQLKYFPVIGYLNYIANCTKPDITYAVERLSTYTSNPNNSHWDALE